MERDADIHQHSCIGNSAEYRNGFNRDIVTRQTS